MSADEDLGFKWSKEPAQSANRLSEEMVQSMAKIYCNLSGVSDNSLLLTGNHQSPTSHFANLTPSSVFSLSESLTSDEVLTNDASSDLYKARGKLSWADVGPYKYAREVRWLSVGKEQLECAAHALGNFRLVFCFFWGGLWFLLFSLLCLWIIQCPFIFFLKGLSLSCRLLVEQLQDIDPRIMTNDEKLAFWINVYNALLMHVRLLWTPFVDSSTFWSIQGYWLHKKNKQQPQSHLTSILVVDYFRPIWHMGFQEVTWNSSIWCRRYAHSFKWVQLLILICNLVFPYVWVCVYMCTDHRVLLLCVLYLQAAYCVGGQWVNAALIECCLLKGKAMGHRPQFVLIYDTICF